MCSVTLWPHARGYRFAMNRDEQRSRPLGLPPAPRLVGNRHALCPSEAGGGTWIGFNDAGAAFALVNWYSIAAPIPARPASRGIVVARLLGTADPDETAREIRRLPLESLRPFRVAGAFGRDHILVEWRWDGTQLAGIEHPWAPRQWLSSGLDESGAQRVRGETFEKWRAAPDAGSAAWLRRLHASHEPERGAFSLCVHRADAVTVSYTEIDWTQDTGTMRHRNGCPCEQLPGLHESAGGLPKPELDRPPV
jgi:hypothetical protein